MRGLRENLGAAVCLFLIVALVGAEDQAAKGQNRWNLELKGELNSKV